MSSRRGRIVLTLLLLVGVIAPSASAQTSALRAGDGDWVGHVGFVGGEIPFRGSFAFTSSGGEVEGTFDWSGASVVTSGVVSGPDTMPRFDLTKVVSAGVDIADVSGGGEIQFTAATCERLEGTGVNIDVARMVDIDSIVWWAVRTDSASDPGRFFEALEALRTEVNQVLDGLESGAVIAGGGVFGRIEPLVADAEVLASELDRTEGCGDEFYRSVIASEVERLLLFALANPDIDVFTLGQILLTAVRAGVLGAGSEGSTSALDSAAQGVVAERIAAAIAAGNFTELEILSLIAEDMGWTDLTTEALIALMRMTG
jgi:hypothetical protein